MHSRACAETVKNANQVQAEFHQIQMKVLQSKIGSNNGIAGRGRALMTPGRSLSFSRIQGVLGSALHPSRPAIFEELGGHQPPLEDRKIVMALTCAWLGVILESRLLMKL